MVLDVEMTSHCKGPTGAIRKESIYRYYGVIAINTFLLYVLPIPSFCRIILSFWRELSLNRSLLCCVLFRTSSLPIVWFTTHRLPKWSEIVKHPTDEVVSAAANPRSRICLYFGERIFARLGRCQLLSLQH